MTPPPAAYGFITALFALMLGIWLAPPLVASLVAFAAGGFGVWSWMRAQASNTPPADLAGAEPLTEAPVMNEWQESLAVKQKADELCDLLTNKIDTPVQGMHQVRNLISGAAGTLWACLRELQFQQRSSQEDLHRLAQDVPASMNEANELIAQAKEYSTPFLTTVVQSCRQSMDAYDAIETVTRQLKRIENQLETLHWIADQTNLLAINTQIEAARVGAVGKGFHVIASEVHQLSSTARTVSAEIGDSLGQAIERGNMAMRHSAAASDYDLNPILGMQDNLQKLSTLMNEQCPRILTGVETLARKTSTSLMKCETGMAAMQFEDISRQVINRSTEDLFRLQGTLRELRGNPHAAPTTTVDPNIESKFQSAEMLATHKPAQEDLSPGEIELF